MKFSLKEVVRAFLICIGIFIVLVVVNVMLGARLSFNHQLGTMFAYTMLYSLVIGYANKLVFVTLDKIFADDRFSFKRIAIGFLSSLAVTLILIFLLRVFEDVVIGHKSFREYLANESPANYLFTVVITIFILLSFYSFYFYKAYNENKVKEQKIIAGTASAKFESLKNQIDPHFLFNSLNVLSSLIEENPESAQKFTTSLSKIYRYVLEQKDKELVTVQEELAFAKTYMNLLKMRFENSITFELPEDFDNPEAKVVPLSLQLLLENTIKHNVVSEQRPLHIKIVIKDNYLVVENALQKKEILSDRKGVGLQNIINRYGILTKRRVLIESSEKVFSVHLPILTKQVMIMETTFAHHENTAYYRAKKRLEELKSFYGNLISYCIVIPILIFINLTYMPQFQWFWFSLGGWGFGVIMHAFKVFGYSSKWEERQIAAILDKEKNTKNWK